MDTTSKQKSLGAWLFNPFTYIAGWQALFLGLAAILTAGYIGSLSNSHFDGVLDNHTGRTAPLWIFLSEGLIDWLALGIVLLVFGKIASKTKFRTLDLLGTQAMARWPMILIAVAAFPDAGKRVGTYLLESIRNPSGAMPPSGLDMTIFGLCAVFAILMICWFVVLSYRSYAISCNIKGGKAVGTFIAGILTAEVLSKILISGMFNLAQ